jgi:HSP20 family protein
MAEVTVVKENKPERKEMVPRMSWDFPLFPGSMFGMNPFALMRRFTDDMDRAFAGFKEPAFTQEEEAFWRPTIEVKELPGKLLVTAELPGVKKEEVKVNVSNGVLTLEGERKHETEEKREGYFHSERSYGKFLRSIALPEGAKVENAAANFTNGVLEITVPIPEKKESRREIPVQDAAKVKSVAA